MKDSDDPSLQHIHTVKVCLRYVPNGREHGVLTTHAELTASHLLVPLSLSLRERIENTAAKVPCRAHYVVFRSGNDIVSCRVLGTQVYIAKRIRSRPLVLSLSVYALIAKLGLTRQARQAAGPFHDIAPLSFDVVGMNGMIE